MGYHNDSHSTVKELNFCQLIANSDQTISQAIRINIRLTKVINQTEGLYNNDPLIYSGIWTPTITIDSLNDRIAYEQQGNYIRYLTPKQIVIIDLSETEFFIKNTQEPIARFGEIIFNNVIFSTACIELFALAFLLIKLAIVPFTKNIISRIENRRSSNTTKATEL